MVVVPKIRRNVCLTAHPAGCAVQVRNQIEFVRRKGPIHGSGNALIIGSSNGYGLASRIVAAFGSGAGTAGVSYERPGTETRPGSAGWYNETAFVKEAVKSGLKTVSVNGDAFSDEIKEKTCGLIKRKLGPIDLVVYSIASPRRLDPKSGELHSSVVKPIGKSCTAKTLDFHTGTVSTITAEPAAMDEIAQTVKVMGGEDWLLWIEALLEAGVLAPNVSTVAYSYVGPAITNPVYRDGTIGRAKQHLESTAEKISVKLNELQGTAVVSVNKALVTRASAVIPAVPLYISLLCRVMKEKKIHENCIQQMYRLFQDHLYSDGPITLDEAGRIRLDDLEMREDVQAEVSRLWRDRSDQLEPDYFFPRSSRIVEFTTSTIFVRV